MKTPETKFEKWLETVDEYRREYWAEHYQFVKYKPLTYSKGSKYVKIISDGSVWGFVSMVNGMNKGAPIKVGDLLMAANYNSPAKHSRGNIFDGTASYGVHGPNYLK